MLRFKTNGFNGYAAEFSPFFADKVAVASASNFGIVGNGRLWIINNSGVSNIYDTQDGCFDVSWSEIHENQLVTGCGDGSVKLWDTTLKDYPLRNYKEHLKEVFSVNWNVVDKQIFLSSSWDNTVKLWNPELVRSLQTYSEHIGCVYQAIWNPNSPTLFGSCSADQTVKLWDSRQKGSLQTIHCHHQEVLTMDWNKYRKDEFVTGSVDQSLKVWDQRMPGKPLCELRGHGFAIRRLKCSPHNGDIVASASYDMTMRVWDLKLGKEIFVFEEHSEFVLGIDFSLFVPGRIVSCGWDELVCILSI